MNISNVSGIIAPVLLFNRQQYQAPATCQLQQNENDTICCNNQEVGVNGTQFCGSLSDIGKLWVANINDLCANVSDTNRSCSLRGNESVANETLGQELISFFNKSGNVSLSSFQECASNNTFDWAKMKNATLLYAFLQNHRNGVEELVNYC